MTKHQAKIIALENASANLRADVEQGGVKNWPGMWDLGVMDIIKVEDAAEELANALARRAARLRAGAKQEE